MRRLLLVFVSLTVGWVGFIHAAETSFGALRSAVPIHAYDGQPMARDTTHSAFEHGPPVTSYDPNATSDVVTQSRAGSSRQSGFATRAIYDYDATALRAQIDTTTATVSVSAQATSGDSSSIERWQVAAETASKVGPTTIHGAERIAGAGATRGGVLAEDQILLVRGSGQLLTQADGAAVRVLQNEAGRFDVVVDGSRGLITTFSNLSQKSLDRLATRYGWE